jgi:hypothetical protein
MSGSGPCRLLHKKCSGASSENEAHNSDEEQALCVTAEGLQSSLTVTENIFTAVILSLSPSTNGSSSLSRSSGVSMGLPSFCVFNFYDL